MFWLLLTACSPIRVAVDRPPAEDPGGYTVVGTATIEVVPDRLDLRATLTAESPRPSDATRRVREQQAALVEALAAAGSPEVAVSQLRLAPVYELVDPRGSKTRIRGYEAAVTLTITSDDFDAAATLMDLVAQHGATDVSTDFRVSNLPELRAQARQQAAAAARDKASAVAEALGVRLGAVRSIHEDAPLALDNRNFNVSMSTGVPDVLHGEEQAVTVSLTVTWDLG